MILINNCYHGCLPGNKYCPGNYAKKQVTCINIELFLEILRVQRHDFVNHLQVVSGFLQLNKTAEVQKYIQEVIVEINRLDKILHLKPPEAAMAFLVAQNEAAKHQIDIEYEIENGLEFCAIPGEEIGWSLKTGLLQVLSCMSSPEVSNRRLKVYLQEIPDSYVCRIYFPLYEKPTGIKEEPEVLTLPMTEQLLQVQEKQRRLAVVYLNGALSDEDYRQQQNELKEQELSIQQRFERNYLEKSTLEVPEQNITTVREAEKQIAAINKRLAVHKGRAGLAMTSGQGEIFLSFPKK